MLSAHAHAAWADQIKNANATYALHSGGPARDGSGSAMVSLDRSIAETLAHALAGTTRLSSQMLRSKPEHRVVRDCKELHHRRR
jgi:hypothetical protein